MMSNGIGCCYDTIHNDDVLEEDIVIAKVGSSIHFLTWMMMDYSLFILGLGLMLITIIKHMKFIIHRSEVQHSEWD